MKRDGNICEWYLRFEGRCSRNGSACYSPFSNEGCDIQCRDILYRNPPLEHRFYEPAKTDKKITKRELWKEWGIKKGDMIGEWIIPYNEMESMNVDPSIVIKEAKEEVKNKFFKANENMDFIRAFHNVEILDGIYGVYVIGVRRH